MANKEMEGAIFLNDKNDNDKAPDFTGSINVEGEKIYCSVWKATAKNDPNKNYLSVKLKFPKDDPRNDRFDKKTEMNGALFLNDTKKDDNAPDFTGKFKLMEGKELFVNAFVRYSDNAGDFLALKLSDEMPSRKGNLGGFLNGVAKSKSKPIISPEELDEDGTDDLPFD